MKKWVIPYLATMKSNKPINWNKLTKSFKQYLKEAEEEGGKEDGNPFAAAADDKGEETPAKDAEGKEGEAAPAAAKPAGIPIKFNINKVKRYNTGKFLSDAGVVKSIDKKGITVTTQPDGVDILVNFDDISESVKKFFKNKKL